MSSRILVARFSCQPTHIAAVQVCAPTFDSSDEQILIRATLKSFGVDAKMAKVLQTMYNLPVERESDSGTWAVRKM